MLYVPRYWRYYGNPVFCRMCACACLYVSVVVRGVHMLLLFVYVGLYACSIYAYACVQICVCVIAVLFEWMSRSCHRSYCLLILHNNVCVWVGVKAGGPCLMYCVCLCVDWLHSRHLGLSKPDLITVTLVTLLMPLSLILLWVSWYDIKTSAVQPVW